MSPPRCAACDQRLGRRALLCAACASTVQRWEGSQDPLAFGLYGGALAQTLLRLKYGGRPDLGGAVGLLLAGVVLARTQDLGPIDVIVPVPVPRSRLVQRGYNQAALIARPLLRPLAARFAPLALQRREGGAKQASLGRHDRLENLRDAFHVREPDRVRTRRVLLVDDVSTTGATIETCTHALLDSGARAVRSAVVARVERADEG